MARQALTNRRATTSRRFHAGTTQDFESERGAKEVADLLGRQIGQGEEVRGSHGPFRDEARQRNDGQCRPIRLLLRPS